MSTSSPPKTAVTPHAEAPARRSPVAGPRPSGRRGAAALLEAMRPRQWLKNVLVLAAPAAAGVLLEPAVAGRIGLCFAAFCLVASGGYLLNDLVDADADRCHPTKRERPIAARRLRPVVAAVVGPVLIAASLLVGALLGWPMVLALVAYVALSLAYTIRLRHVALLDLVTVAAFFVVRAVAGGLAADVPLSRWFLIVASFGSLFIVAAKRAGEHLSLGEERAATRPALTGYSLAYLRSVRTLSATVAVTAYCLWALDPVATTGTEPLVELSILPFVLFILRYAMLVEDAGDQPPEDLVLQDQGLRAAAVLWLIVFGAGVTIGV